VLLSGRALGDMAYYLSLVYILNIIVPNHSLKLSKETK
jgi:hypothetical protein